MNFDKMSFEEWEDFSREFKFMGLSLAEIRKAVNFAKANGWDPVHEVVHEFAPLRDTQHVPMVPPFSPEVVIPTIVIPTPAAGQGGSATIMNDRGFEEIIQRAEPTPQRKKTGPYHTVRIREYLVVEGKRAPGPEKIFENIATVEDRGEMMVLNQKMSPAHAGSPIYIAKDTLAALEME